MQNSNIKHKYRGVEILVRGTVQGVGFRPFIYNLASCFEIGGTVSNSGDGVVIRVTAEEEDRLKSFLQAIEEQMPPLARITSIECSPLAVDRLDSSFSILPSTAGIPASTAIPPDIGLCEDCLQELLEPGNRRFHYPFINCTNCGPRLTIIESIPYDRPQTSMKLFPMCAPCEKEYHDPGNRRFHAQPNACPDCGPNISLHDKKGKRLATKAPLTQTAHALQNGLVLAIRGMGGFHLSVNGCCAEAVSLLRSRKGRPDKPLAIMVPDIEAVKNFCHVLPEEEKLLCSPEHPIVLLKQRGSTDLAANLAPGIEEIGVMLPYTPLHHLLFQQYECPKALVMTSGNISSTPICTDNNDALSRLGNIADLFLLHDREIVTRVDDSVLKVIDSHPLLLRRARGYVPAPVRVSRKLPKVLACGSGLKNTFSLGRGHDVFTSQHIGDLDNLQSFDFYRESISHLKSLLQLEPEAVVCDLHPDYLSSHYAVDLDLPLYKVQHHHAHAVAVMAEHQLEEPVLAVVLDGTGLGADDTIWGGEILLAELTSYKRLAHLSHLRLPGGDAAAAEPWRMGLSALFASYGPEAICRKQLPRSLDHLDDESLTVISSMLSNGFNSPLTSSCGRLFDGVASLLGVRQRISYEGQAAMELETLAKKVRTPSWTEDLSLESHPGILRSLVERDGTWEICSVEFIKSVMDGLHRGEPVSSIALQFHKMLIGAITSLAGKLSQQTGIRQVVLSGGCMQNSLLLEGFFHSLKSINLEVFTGNSLPINDGAISFGQTVIGGLRHVSRNTDEGNRRSG